MKALDKNILFSKPYLKMTQQNVTDILKYLNKSKKKMK